MSQPRAFGRNAEADRSPCPGGASGFVLWDVETSPSQADNVVGAADNDIGLVCARAMPGTFRSITVARYSFPRPR